MTQYLKRRGLPQPESNALNAMPENNLRRCFSWNATTPDKQLLFIWCHCIFCRYMYRLPRGQQGEQRQSRWRWRHNPQPDIGDRVEDEDAIKRKTMNVKKLLKLPGGFSWRAAKAEHRCPRTSPCWHFRQVTSSWTVFRCLWSGGWHISLRMSPRIEHQKDKTGQIIVPGSFPEFCNYDSSSRSCWVHFWGREIQMMVNYQVMIIMTTQIGIEQLFAD